MEELNTNQPSSKRQGPPKISPLVKKWMPDASESELEEATENFRRYLAVAYRVYERLEREGRLPGGLGNEGTKK